MIIDVNRLAGLNAYLKSDQDEINLAPLAPMAVRTRSLKKRQQLDIDSLEFMIEGDDLASLLARQQTPMLSISVQKEMFPGVFADPYRQRVLNIAGFEDFNRGSFQNGRTFDIDGMPTIVSMGTGISTWSSRWYDLPQAIDLNFINWELATSRLTPDDALTYTISISYKEYGELPDDLPHEKTLASQYSPSQERFIARDDLKKIIGFQIHFSAEVNRDSYLSEQHTAVLGAPVGTPLLRAFNLLSDATSPIVFYSLEEFLAACDSYQFVPINDLPGKRLLAELSLNAILTGKEEQSIQSDRYEFVQLELGSSAFTRFQVRMVAEEAMRPLND